MSTILATCGHKAEWIDPICGKCSVCCECPEEADPVHINSKAAALALASYARRKRAQYDKEINELNKETNRR